MKPVLALVGPTAAGKSRMAVEVVRTLAEREVSVEVVSCDSMGVYRGLDIAADKPSEAERSGVPHHLFDLVEPDEEYTAVRYREDARAILTAVHDREGVPLLVGGSGLYFRAAVDDLEFAPTDPALRARLAREPPAVLADRLRAVDPESAARIDPRNVRRVVRALEIHELTGRGPSDLRRSWERFESPFHLVVAGLTWARDVLMERAVERVHAEIAAGLVDEIRSVLPEGISKTAMQALGVKEIVEHIEGRATLEEATATLVRNTKRFVRRQLSWFRADPRVRWVDASVAGWDGAREQIVRMYRAALPGVAG